MHAPMLPARKAMKEPLLAAESLTKSFASQCAVDSVSFDIHEGEVVGLLGANGAGKSTLLKLLGGTLTPDAGRITLRGEPVSQFSPEVATSHGIASVYQELSLFGNMTVAENLFIGREPRKRLGTIDWRAMRRLAQGVLEEYGLSVSAETLVSNLSVAQQHMLEIVRAFNERPRLLLLDEPTSALSEAEASWLFGWIRQVAEQGTAIIYVSHRLDEVTEICDRTVILRDGEVAYASREQLDKSAIIHHMVGRDVVLDRQYTEKNERDIVFEVTDLRSEQGVVAEHLYVRKGEILGIAGLMGSGRTELLQALFGLVPLVSGTVLKDGQAVHIGGASEAIDHGIAYIPEDRKLEGLFLAESGRFNIAASTLRERSRAGLVRTSDEKAATTEASSRVMLDVGRLDHDVAQLSGGNQQKAVIARTLLADADVLLLDEPTRGVDIGAREEIYDVIHGVVQSGRSVILVTSDWEELIYLSHRIAIMSEKRVVGEIHEEITESAILHMAETPPARDANSSPPRQVSSTSSRRSWPRISPSNSIVILALILFALLVVGSVLSPRFASAANIRNLFGQSMPLLILSLGQLIVIIAGGIDVSSGALMAASGVMGATLMSGFGWPFPAAIAAMVVLGTAVGSANALLAFRAKVDPFVVTIGTFLILEGVALVISPRPVGASPDVLRTIVGGQMLGIPAAAWLLVFLCAAFVLVLRYTRLGRSLFAVGESKVIAFFAGLRVPRVVLISYVACSLMSVVASLYILGRFGGADPVLGPGMELEAIASVLIGGATLAGGRGSVAGTVMGVFIIGVLANLFSLMEVSVWYQQVIRGVLLLVIIASYERVMRSRPAVL